MLQIALNGARQARRQLLLDRLVGLRLFRLKLDPEETGEGEQVFPDAYHRQVPQPELARRLEGEQEPVSEAHGGKDWVGCV